MTRTQLCEPKERRRVVADGPYLQMPKLMGHGDIRFGSMDFDLRLQINWRLRRWRIDPIRRWMRDAICAEHPRFRERQVAIHKPDGFVGPVVKSVLMSVNEGGRRQHRHGKHTEQNPQSTKRRPNSPIAIHMAGR
jgi:hypothetical protein